MITYYNVFLILAAVGIEVRCQYLLKEYAPDHDNYESYSFAYGVSDPISGDHKHQWERMEHGHVRGEYGLMEPDGLMRLVQYTAGPKEGFQATVTKLAVRVASPEYTQGQELYQEGGHYAGIRYAAKDNSGLQLQQGINLNVESNIGNPQQIYVQQNDLQNQEDYANQESRQHAVVSRAPSNFTDTSNRRKKDQSSSNRRKQIVKKNIETNMHLLQSGFTSGGTEYMSNFNLNPINIEQLNIPNGEKQILQGLSVQGQPLIQNEQRIIASIHNPRPFTLQNHAFNPTIHPALINFQKEVGNSQIQGYQITPNLGQLVNQKEQYSLPLILKQSQIQSLPTSIQDVKATQEINDSKRLQNALALIHSQPEINTRLQNLHSQYNIPLDPVIQINEQQNYQQDPKILNVNQNGYSAQPNILSQYYDDPRFGPNLEGKRYNNENQTQEQKEQERQYLLGLAPLQNVPQSQIYTDNSQQQYLYSNQNIPQRYTDSNQQYNSEQVYQPSYGQYQQSHPEISNERTKLNSQNHYPVVLVDPDAKFGLPFYPSTKEIHQIPNEEFNYEGIPLFGPSLEGKRYNTENQTLEEKEQERAYLLGLSPGPIFAPPPGYTRETIWQAGDKDADPEPEILVRQLNETCAYIQFNETTPGNEDGRPNIWQAGDYSAQNQEEELIRSVNITCENYTTDYMNKFSSGFTVADNCWQCVRNDGSEYIAENNEQQGIQDGGNNEQQIDYVQNGANNQQQIGYVQNTGGNEQQIGYVQNGANSVQQVGYVQNAGGNEQQIGYVQNGANNEQQGGYVQNAGGNEQQTGYVNGNNEQNQNYETSVENYAPAQINSPQTYDNSQGENYYQQGEAPMKVALYPNIGYRNEPQSREYGLYRRRSTKKQKSKNRAETVPDSKKS